MAPLDALDHAGRELLRAVDQGAADFTQVRVSATTALREARMLRSFAESHIDVDATRRFVNRRGHSFRRASASASQPRRRSLSGMPDR
jgi:hypothetical protein